MGEKRNEGEKEGKEKGEEEEDSGKWKKKMNLCFDIFGL